MDILYLISYAGAAGTEKYVENLMNLASRQGHRCHLCFCEAGPLSEKMRAAGFPVLQMNLKPAHIPAAARRLGKYCREQGIGVIHAQYPRENVIALLAKKHCPGLKAVFTSHLTIAQGKLWRFINRRLTGGNHRIISVCRQNVEQLKKNGYCPDRITVIPNGVEPGPEPLPMNKIREEFSLPEDCFVMVTMARYAPEKGLHWLMEVLETLKARTQRPFACLIAGTGEEFDAIAMEVKKRGLDREVIQAGYRTDGRELMLSSEVYVSTALYNEAMSFAILEAMSCGLPLAVTDVGAGKELAEEGIRCGFCVSPGDTEAMAENLRRLMENEELRRELGRRAREKVCRSYDLDTVCRQVLESYS